MGNSHSPNIKSETTISFDHVEQLDCVIERFLKQHCLIESGLYINQDILCDAFMEFENVRINAPNYINRNHILNKISKIANLHAKKQITFFESNKNKLVINMALISFPS